MPFAPPAPEPVPLGEVAAVLTDAVQRASGGAVRLIPVHGDYPATALIRAGFVITRETAAGAPQLTL